jgi:hypothetical protein
MNEDLINYLNFRVDAMQNALDSLRVENLKLLQKLEYYQATVEVTNQNNFIYGNI